MYKSLFWRSLCRTWCVAIAWLLYLAAYSPAWSSAYTQSVEPTAVAGAGYSVRTSGWSWDYVRFGRTEKWLRCLWQEYKYILDLLLVWLSYIVSAWYILNKTWFASNNINVHPWYTYLPSYSHLHHTYTSHNTPSHNYCSILFLIFCFTWICICRYKPTVTKEIGSLKV